MDESIVEFVRSVRIERCRVINTPHLVFLCGGLISASVADSVLSARDHFHRYIKAQAPELSSRVRLAEEINRWFDQDTFSDLLELEIYLADSSDLTILFVESPGSIAELGAFAAEKLLRPRTLAVLNTAHPLNGTFIADGPVRRIKAEDKNLIRYYEWSSQSPHDDQSREVLEEMSEELVQYVRELTGRAPKEKLLNRDSHGHLMFLIADLVDVIGITTGSEIIECLSMWGCELDWKELQKYLVLLEHLCLLKRKPHSDQIYYLSVAKSTFIKHHFTPGAKVRDRERIKTLIRTALSQSDQRRMKVYQRELRGPLRPGRRHD